MTLILLYNYKDLILHSGDEGQNEVKKQEKGRS